MGSDQTRPSYTCIRLSASSGQFVFCASRLCAGYSNMGKIVVCPLCACIYWLSVLSSVHPPKQPSSAYDSPNRETELEGTSAIASSIFPSPATSRIRDGAFSGRRPAASSLPQESSLLRQRLTSETELSSPTALVFHPDILSSPVAGEASLLPSVRARVVSLPALPSLSPCSCPTTPSPSPSSLLLRFRLPSRLRLPFFSGSVFPPVCLPDLPCPETPSRLPPLVVSPAAPLFSAFRTASVALSSFVHDVFHGNKFGIYVALERSDFAFAQILSLRLLGFLDSVSQKAHSHEQASIHHIRNEILAKIDASRRSLALESDR
ncbi:hypothetical protein ACLOJK_036810 [Asimina triloba]